MACFRRRSTYDDLRDLRRGAADLVDADRCLLAVLRPPRELDLDVSLRRCVLRAEVLFDAFDVLRVFVVGDFDAAVARRDDLAAPERTRARTSWSFLIECQPCTPFFFASCARSFTVSRFSFSAVVNGLFSRLPNTLRAALARSNASRSRRP